MAQGRRRGAGAGSARPPRSSRPRGSGGPRAPSSRLPRGASQAEAHRHYQARLAAHVPKGKPDHTLDYLKRMVRGTGPQGKTAQRARGHVPEEHIIRKAPIERRKRMAELRRRRAQELEAVVRGFRELKNVEESRRSMMAAILREQYRRMKAAFYPQDEEAEEAEEE